MKILVTGGAGFIGSHFIRYILQKYPHYQIINFDDLTYSGNLGNLLDISSNPHYQFIKGDICDNKRVEDILASRYKSALSPNENVEVILNFAAESHVDRSINDPQPFIRTNIIGTHILLEAAKKFKVKKYIQISTDEVYGTLGTTGKFSELSCIAPNSPYSASKAGADMLALSYFKTYGINVNITRCSNNFGPYQFPEKLIPLMIYSALEDRELTVYGDGANIRDWIYVIDHCSAIDMVMHGGKPGEIYNIGANNERTNLEIVNMILTLLNKPKTLIQFVDDRPGHDYRYAVDTSKIMREFGWKPLYPFQTAFEYTVRWFSDNREWWKKYSK